MDESSPTNLLLEKWGADPPFQLIELGAIKMSFIRVLQLDIGYNLITDPRKIGLVELALDNSSMGNICFYASSN